MSTWNADRGTRGEGESVSSQQSLKLDHVHWCTRYLGKTIRPRPSEWIPPIDQESHLRPEGNCRTQELNHRLLGPERDPSVMNRNKLDVRCWCTLSRVLSTNFFLCVTGTLLHLWATDSIMAEVQIPPINQRVVFLKEREVFFYKQRMTCGTRFKY